MNLNNIKKVKIYGERCSGTNYLEELIKLNFNVEIIKYDYGCKHFFGFNPLLDSDDVLFIGIVRNLEDWINSLYREKYHIKHMIDLELDKEQRINQYLNNEMYSVDERRNEEIIQDRHIYTRKRYKNIFELRHIKNEFLIKEMPKKVKNYILITHDELINNFTNVMNNIQKYNLEINKNIEYPINILYNIKNKNNIFLKKDNEISKNIIMEKANLYYEKILFPQLY